MSGERLELVTDFASLRAGLLVVVKSCRRCGAAHRGMLVSLCDGPGHGHRHDRHGPGWVRLPTARCGPSSWVGASTVADGRLFRVVDGLDQAADEQTAFEDAIRSAARRNRAVAR